MPTIPTIQNIASIPTVHVDYRATCTKYTLSMPTVQNIIHTIPSISSVHTSGATSQGGPSGGARVDLHLIPSRGKNDPSSSSSFSNQTKPNQTKPKPSLSSCFHFCTSWSAILNPSFHFNLGHSQASTIKLGWDIMQNICCSIFKCLAWPSFTLPSPASPQMDDSEKKTCSVPVHFAHRSKSWSLGRVQHVTFQIIKLKANIEKNMQQDLEVLKTIHTDTSLSVPLLFLFCRTWVGKKRSHKLVEKCFKTLFTL